MGEFEGLKAVVTGGASGLGAAIARKLITEGAAVAVLDRDVSNAPESTVAVVADVTDDATVVAAVQEVVARLGGIDILVNNAGIGAQGDIAANDDAEWHRIWDVNVVGIARVTRAALPHLLASDHPAVVNTSSVAAHTGLPQRALYTATKGAVSALTRAMAADHLHDGIRVNSVSPGTADTPWIGGLLSKTTDPDAELAALRARQPHGRLVAPEEIADAVAYLASPRSGSTTGHDLSVDGGLSTIKVPPRA